MISLKRVVQRHFSLSVNLPRISFKSAITHLHCWAIYKLPTHHKTNTFNCLRLDELQKIEARESILNTELSTQ